MEYPVLIPARLEPHGLGLRSGVSWRDLLASKAPHKLVYSPFRSSQADS
jgi:hypothetical protein